MANDRYGLPLNTTSDAAGAAYNEACNLLLTLYPGAGAGFDRAIEADPSFALAHAGRARLLQVSGKLPEARAAIAAAAACPADARGISQIGVFQALIEGRAAEAFAAVCAHTERWPTDAMVLATTANQLGLIGISGRAGRVGELAAFLDRLAPAYGDDWWFGAHYGMAVAEAGRHAEGRRIVERSLAANPNNGSVAHSFAHICYEDGQADEGIAFLRSWLPGYTRFGGMYGHLSWHLALFELHRGNAEEGFRMFGESFGAEDYPGPLPNKMFDSAAFLWRSELAGHKRDEARWAMLRDFAHARFPQPGLNLLDWHVALAEAVMGMSTRWRGGSGSWKAVRPKVGIRLVARSRPRHGRSRRSNGKTTPGPLRCWRRCCRSGSGSVGATRRSICWSSHCCGLTSCPGGAMRRRNSSGRGGRARLGRRQGFCTDVVSGVRGAKVWATFSLSEGASNPVPPWPPI